MAAPPGGAGFGGMAAPAWRQFTFFDPTAVRDRNDFSLAPAALQNPNEIACVTTCPSRPPETAFELLPPAENSNGNTSTGSTGQPCFLVADISGTISALDPVTYEPLISWSAFDRGRATHLSCDARGRIVGIGEEEGARFPLMKVWDIRRGRKTQEGWRPQLLTEGRVQHGSRPHPVAALAHTPSLSYLAAGLANGTVLLLRGLDSSLLTAVGNTGPSPGSVSAAVALPKFKVVFEPSTLAGAKTNEGAHEPVTGLGFAEASAASSIASGGFGLGNTITGSASAGASALSKLPPARRSGRGSRGGRAGVNGSGPVAGPAQAIQNAQPTTVHLFIVTLGRILSYTVLGRGAGSPAAVVDDVGCALGCAAVVPSNAPLVSASASSTSRIAGTAKGEKDATGELGRAPVVGPLEGKMVVARDEAIYVVGAEGREACYAYEGPKSSIKLSSSQLIIVSPPLLATTASASATVRQYAAGREVAGRRATSEIAKVAVFDLDNKFVAYNGTFEGGVREAWVGPEGEICVLGDDGGLTRLDEKPLRAKLEILFRKSLFLLAVNLARSHAARAGSPDVATGVEPILADIFRKYGDHLYVKGDFEGAMTQFVKTIGWTQPSYVIRKFLDAQRINNLTIYLQELHARGMANSDHTTLLLNCYTKLKDVASLDRFIKRPPSSAKGADVSLAPDHNALAEEGATDEDGEQSGAGKEELPFDLETAMRVCRQAGYHTHAAYLAKRYKQHDEYMRIQIEDAKDFMDALAYIRSLDPAETERNLVRYGKTLLSEVPEQTTDLLIELCSGAYRPNQPALVNGDGTAASKDGAQSRSSAAAYLSYLQVGGYGKTPAAATAASIGTSTPSMNNASRRGSIAAVEPYAVDGPSRRATHPDGTDQGAGHAGNSEGNPKGETVEGSPPYQVPSPRTFFAHFIQHPEPFARFLETVALARWGQSINMDAHTRAAVPTPLPGRGSATPGHYGQTDQVLGTEPNDEHDDGADFDPATHKDECAIWNTLLELYVTTSRSDASSASGDSASTSVRVQRRERALRLLEQHDTLPYDATQALVLCSMEHFTDGLVLLYERMGMFEDVLRFWMDESVPSLAHDGASEKDNASCKVMAALRRYGPTQPQLYPLVLRYLVSSEQLLATHREDLAEVLRHIEDDALMSPLEVVQALARTGVASVGLVREYLSRAINQERAEIEGDRRLIESYRSETGKKLSEVAELSDPETPKVFQLTRCTACGGQLDLPSVHFMCKHSYHQRCLGDNETECPNCARAHGVIREIRRANEALADRHDLFLGEVEEADEGFETVATMFSKGLMGMAQLDASAAAAAAGTGRA